MFGASRSGVVKWFLERLRHTAHAAPKLIVVERVSLAPRQLLALVETDGQRLLVATSPEGSARFCRLNSRNPAPSHRDGIPVEGTVE